MYISVQSLCETHEYMHACLSVNIHVYIGSESLCTCAVNVMYIYIHTYIHTYVYVNIRIHTSKFISIYTMHIRRLCADVQRMTYDQLCSYVYIY